MTKKIILLDASSFENSACLRKVQLSNIQGLQPNQGNDALDFGQAVHRSIAKFRTDLALKRPVSIEACIKEGLEYYVNRMCPKLPPRTPAALEEALVGYFQKSVRDPFYPLVAGDKVAIEIPFKIPFYSTPTVDVLLSGVIDGIGLYGTPTFGTMTLRDIKTSTTTKIAQHIKEQLDRPQFHVYSYSACKLGYSPPNKFLPIQIDGIYLQKDGSARYEQSAIYNIPEFMIDNTITALKVLARQLAEFVEQGVEQWPHNYNQCHGKYRLCEFNNICTVPKESQHVPIKFLYSTRVYDPTTFGE